MDTCALFTECISSDIPNIPRLEIWMTAEVRVNTSCFSSLLLCIGIAWMCGMGIIIADATCGRPGRTVGTVHEPGGDSFKTGDKISYGCTNESNVLLGDSKRECFSNGSWSGEIPVCSKLARLKEIQHFNDDAKVRANLSVDGNLSTCVETSFNSTIWAGYILSSCVNISAVQIVFQGRRDLNAEVIVKGDRYEILCWIGSESTVSFKTTLTFYCPTGAVGEFIYVRNNYQSWKICEVFAFLPPAQTCLTPDVPKYGNGRLITSGEISVYAFECLDGYKMWGSRNVTCQANGTWLPKSPTCAKIECFPPSKPDNGNVEYEVINGKIPYSGTAKFRCNDGFYLEGQSTITCKHWDQWDSLAPKCKARTSGNYHSSKAFQCGNLPTVANGALVSNSTEIRSIAWLKCNEGFRPLTVDHVFCLSTGNWSIHSLYCTAIQCDLNPIVPHGAIILLNNSSYYGAHLQIICNQGYTSHDTIIRKCEKSGTWGDLNVCVEITCGVFNPIEISNGEWIPLNDSHSIRILVCPEDYHIEGSPPVTRCLSNKSWSYTSAMCRNSMEANDWANSWTPNLMLIAAVALGAGTAIFILCLFLAFMIVRKRRLMQTNATVFHLQNRNRKNDTRELNFHQDMHHSASKHCKGVALRPKTICTNPRKPHSALPNLPLDTDPVYAQPFETVVEAKKKQSTTTNKKDDSYNAHIYAEPVDSRRSTTGSITMPFNVTLSEVRAESRIHSNINLQSESSTSIRNGQQNCDNKCAIYESSSYSTINDGKLAHAIGDKYERNNVKPSLCTFTNNSEYMGLL